MSRLGRALRDGLLGKARAQFHGLGPKGEHPSRADGLRRRYNELIFAVGTKYPGESRHETALRYIHEREDGPVSGPFAA